MGKSYARYELAKALRGVRRLVVERDAGVYILVKDKVVTYVGMSLSVWERLSRHVKEKEFDEVLYLPVKGGQAEAKHLETILIRVLQPSLNRTERRPATITDVDTLMTLVAGGVGAARELLQRADPELYDRTEMRRICVDFVANMERI